MPVAARHPLAATALSQHHLHHVTGDVPAVVAASVLLHTGTADLSPGAAAHETRTEVKAFVRMVQRGPLAKAGMSVVASVDAPIHRTVRLSMCTHSGAGPLYPAASDMEAPQLVPRPYCSLAF